MMNNFRKNALRNIAIASVLAAPISVFATGADDMATTDAARASYEIAAERSTESKEVVVESEKEREVLSSYSPSVREEISTEVSENDSSDDENSHDKIVFNEDEEAEKYKSVRLESHDLNELKIVDQDGRDISEIAEDNSKPREVENNKITESPDKGISLLDKAQEENIKTPAEEENTKTPAEEANLELSPDINPKNLESADMTREPRDITNELLNTKVKIRKQRENIISLEADDGEAIFFDASFVTPKGTRAGDTITINLSDNYTLKGLEPETDEVLSIESGDVVIATGKKDGNKIIYTFTDAVNDKDYAFGYVNFGGFDNKEFIKNSGNQTFSVNIGNVSASKDLYVDYGRYAKNGNLEIKSQFTDFNVETGEFTQVIYINPNSYTVYAPTISEYNKSIGLTIDNGILHYKKESDAYFTKDNTSVEVLKLNKNQKLPDAVYKNPVNARKDESVILNYDKGIAYIDLNKGAIDTPYVIKVTSKLRPDANPHDLNLFSEATLYGNAMHSIYDNSYYDVSSNNSLQYVESNAGGLIPNGKGTFKEHHVYYTRIDGKTQDNPITIDSNTFSGYKGEEYVTAKKEFDGYKFDHIDTNSLKDNPAYNSDGSTTVGTFEEKKNKEITYIYFKDIKTPVEEKGSFTEKHIYTEYENGYIARSTTLTNKKLVGYENESFVTSAKPNGTADAVMEGFRLVKEEIKKSPEITANIDGSEVTLNFIPNKDLEIIYIYRKDTNFEKQVEERGSFTERHVYEEYENGELITTTTATNDKIFGNSDETFTTSAKPNGTELNIMEGYTLVKEKIEKSPEIKEDINGSLVTTNFVPNKDLLITYYYRKDTTPEKPIEEKGSFTERHIYEEYRDGKLVNTSEIKLDKMEGNTDDLFVTSAKPNGIAGDKKEGFRLIPERITKSKEITENIDGTEVEANFIIDKDLEVTYVYRKDTYTEKPTEEKGSFTERHIYEEYSDGKLVSTSEIKLKKIEGTSDDKFTTSAKPNGTEENKKEGFKLVSDKITKSSEITVNVDGSVVEYNFIPNKDLEVTYVYRKDVFTKNPKNNDRDIEKPGKDKKSNRDKITNRDKNSGGDTKITITPKTEIVPEPIKPIEPMKNEENKKVEDDFELILSKSIPEKSENIETIKTVETSKESIKGLSPLKVKEDYSKAPKTYDAGVLSYVGLGGFASALLAFFESWRRKRK